MRASGTALLSLFLVSNFVGPSLAAPLCQQGTSACASILKRTPVVDDVIKAGQKETIATFGKLVDNPKYAAIVDHLNKNPPPIKNPKPAGINAPKTPPNDVGPDIRVNKDAEKLGGSTPPGKASLEGHNPEPKLEVQEGAAKPPSNAAGAKTVNVDSSSNKALDASQGADAGKASGPSQGVDANKASEASRGADANKASGASRGVDASDASAVLTPLVSNGADAVKAALKNNKLALGVGGITIAGLTANEIAEEVEEEAEEDAEEREDAREDAEDRAEAREDAEERAEDARYNRQIASQKARIDGLEKSLNAKVAGSGSPKDVTKGNTSPDQEPTTSSSKDTAKGTKSSQPEASKQDKGVKNSHNVPPMPADSDSWSEYEEQMSMPSGSAWDQGVPYGSGSDGFSSSTWYKPDKYPTKATSGHKYSHSAQSGDSYYGGSISGKGYKGALTPEQEEERVAIIKSMTLTADQKDNLQNFYLLHPTYDSDEKSRLYDAVEAAGGLDEQTEAMLFAAILSREHTLEEKEDLENMFISWEARREISEEELGWLLHTVDVAKVEEEWW